MLTTLRIKNLALVPDLTLELQPGCNVITGETGAGKSIIIGALNLVLGDRADRSLLRSGSDSCSVEAVFEIKKLRAPLGPFLEENGLEPCDDHQLVLKRTLTSAGANRQFINGSPTTLSTLAAVGEWLVDMHGPHDHQSLLHPAKQLAILDAFGGLEKERADFGERVRSRAALAAEKSALIVDEKTYAQQLDLLRFQVKEISSARLQPGEDEQVEAAFQRSSNAARLLQLSQTALDALSENDNSLMAQAGQMGRTLQELQRVDAGTEGMVALHAQAAGAWRELQSELSRYAENVDIDPAQLQQLEARMDLLRSLKRKYGATLPEVMAFGAEAAEKLAALEGRDAELARINQALDALDATLLAAGKKLTAARRKVIPLLTKAVVRQLADLGFRQSQFDVEIRSAAASSPRPFTASSSPGTSALADGPAVAAERAAPLRTDLDEIEFQFAPNPGEPARPLRAIASSGEMARVMLALKTVLAAQDEIPVLVFDEVDANVGGETAHAVGEKMKQIAANRQVLCITHLPQVAAPADAHYVVTKLIRDGRTVSEITRLAPKERVTELARMLGGQTDAARKHARSMLSSDPASADRD